MVGKILGACGCSALRQLELCHNVLPLARRITKRVRDHSISNIWNPFLKSSKLSQNELQARKPLLQLLLVISLYPFQSSSLVHTSQMAGYAPIMGSVPPVDGFGHAFGFVVPGRPPQYSDSFQQIDAAKWSADIENSQQIRDVVVFLTTPLTIPGIGLSCYITGYNAYSDFGSSFDTHSDPLCIGINLMVDHHSLHGIFLAP